MTSFELIEVPVSKKTLWRILALKNDRGFSGYGEFTYDGAPDDIVTRMREFAGSLVDKPAYRDSLGKHRKNWRRNLADATIYSGAEQALADLESRICGRPLWEHLGGDAGIRTVPLYANINRRTIDRTPAGFADSAARCIAAGFSRIKIAPFDGVSPADTDFTLVEAGLERIGAVRDAIGERELMVDCHWRFAASTIGNLVNTLASMNVSWLECPICESESNIGPIVELRKLVNRHAIRLAGLEGAVGWEGFRPFVEAGAYDVVMPDIKHCGGYSDFLEIAERARKYNVAVSAHNPTGPIAHLGSLHVTAAIGANEPLEVQFDESPLFHELTEPPPPVLGENSHLPAGPGLGVRLVTVNPA